MCDVQVSRAWKVERKPMNMVSNIKHTKSATRKESYRRRRCEVSLTLRICHPFLVEWRTTVTDVLSIHQRVVKFGSDPVRPRNMHLMAMPWLTTATVKGALDTSLAINSSGGPLRLLELKLSGMPPSTGFRWYSEVISDSSQSLACETSMSSRGCTCRSTFYKIHVELKAPCDHF